MTAARPGEWTQIDSTPLDVRVVLDTGIADRVELTWIIDLATRTIPAAVLRPTTKAADAAVLLARMLTPEPMRPGWTDAVRMSRSVLPHRRLTDLDERLEHAAARPVIVPETVVCDHGSVCVSRSFQSACRAMGISFQPTHKGSPWEKGTVETSFNAVGSLFAQYVAGYTGSSVEHRGENAGQDAVWSIVELQALLDEWIVTTWQNRPHTGLLDPVAPDRALTPNEKYAALVQAAGYVPVPLSADDYVELLPVAWHAINKVRHPPRQAHLRLQGAQPLPPPALGDRAQEGPVGSPRRPLRHHPALGPQPPRRRVDHRPLEAPEQRTRPVRELAWKHAREILARRGQDQATEAEIAQAASDLLDKAGRGPRTGDPSLTRRDRRVAGRTRATSAPSGPRPVPDDSGPGRCPSPADDPGETGEQAADVIPLPIFDARKEAERWRF